MIFPEINVELLIRSHLTALSIYYTINLSSLYQNSRQRFLFLFNPHSDNHSDSVFFLRDSFKLVSIPLLYCMFEQ